MLLEPHHIRRNVATAGRLLAEPPIWVVVAIVVLINCLGLYNVTDKPLAEENDTPAIMREIRKDTSAPGLVSWFARDWPIQNKFYRPLVVLSLAADNAIYGNRARGYRLTNWLLACMTAGAVCWLLTELTGRRGFGLLGGVVFSLLQSVPQVVGGGGAPYVAAVLVVGLAVCRSRRFHVWAGGKWVATVRRILWVAAGAYVLLACDWVYTGTVVNWIAARTALMGTLFSALALGSYARLLRQGMSVSIVLVVGGFAACALASYEQSAMLPLAAGTMLLLLRPRRMKSALVGLLVLFGVLAIYSVFRIRLLGLQASPYQLMQLRSSAASGVRALLWYGVPLTHRLWTGVVRIHLSGGIWGLFDAVAWSCLAVGSIAVAVYTRAFLRGPRWLGGLVLMKVCLFLPMAALHVFPHYYYMPQIAAAGVGATLLWPDGISNVRGDDCGSRRSGEV